MATLDTSVFLRAMHTHVQNRILKNDLILTIGGEICMVRNIILRLIMMQLDTHKLQAPQWAIDGGALEHAVALQTRNH